MLVAASLAGAATADARPKRPASKKEFDRGVVAYQKGNFAAAAEALGKSYELEHDLDTLFAWAQTERKLDHCDKAIDLYQKLLESNLPAANKAAVEAKLGECRAIIAAQAPKPRPEPPASAPAAAPEPSPSSPPAATVAATRAAEPPPSPRPAASRDPASRTVAPRDPARPAATRDPVPRDPAPRDPAPRTVASRDPVSRDPAPRDTAPGPRAWYRDPVTLGLLGGGVIATSVGTGFLLSARSEHTAVAGSPSLDVARTHADNAKSRLQIGFITGGVGVALVGGGVAWMLMHRSSGEQRTITGWLTADGGGLAIVGPF